MMGRQRRQMAMIFVDIESLIPETHLLRKIDRMVSFNFIYDLLAPYYAATEGLQKSYVQNIIDKYSVGPSALAELMGANAGAVGVYLSKRGFSFKRGFQPTKDDLERFREDYGISTNAPTKK